MFQTMPLQQRQIDIVAEILMEIFGNSQQIIRRIGQTMDQDYGLFGPFTMFQFSGMAARTDDLLGETGEFLKVFRPEVTYVTFSRQDTLFQTLSENLCTQCTK